MKASLSPQSKSTAALSLLETVFSLALLAVVMSSLVGGMAAMVRWQGEADTNDEANDLLRHISEKVQSTPFAALGQSSRPWAEARYLDDPAGGYIAEELENWGLVSKESRLEDLEVYIEYYRGLDRFDAGQHHVDYTGTFPGVMQRDGETAEAYATRISPAVLDTTTSSTPYRVDTNEILGIDVDNSLDRMTLLVVRVIVTWTEDDVDRRFDLMSAMARPVEVD